MTLESELIETMARAMWIARGGLGRIWDECKTHPPKEGSELYNSVVLTWDQAKAALSAHSAFLAERGLKVVWREATRHQIKVMKGAVKRYNKSLGHGESASSEAFPTIYYESGVVAAPDLFAEAPDAR